MAPLHSNLSHINRWTVDAHTYTWTSYCIIVLEFCPYDCGVHAPVNGQGTHSNHLRMKPGLCDPNSE